MRVAGVKSPSHLYTPTCVVTQEPAGSAVAHFRCRISTSCAFMEPFIYVNYCTDCGTSVIWDGRIYGKDFSDVGRSPAPSAQPMRLLLCPEMTWEVGSWFSDIGIGTSGVGQVKELMHPKQDAINTDNLTRMRALEYSSRSVTLLWANVLQLFHNRYRKRPQDHMERTSSFLLTTLLSLLSTVHATVIKFLLLR